MIKMVPFFSYRIVNRQCSVKENYDGPDGEEKQTSFIHSAGFDNYHWKCCTWSRMCTKIVAYVMYMGKYQKAYINRHTFYLLIFPTIFPKLVVKKRIANSKNEKKNYTLTPIIIFQKNILSEDSVKLCFLVTFNIILSYIFPKISLKFIKSLSEDQRQSPEVFCKKSCS